MTVRGFGKSFGEQTWRKQLGETIWRYTEIGEYLEKILKRDLDLDRMSGRRRMALSDR